MKLTLTSLITISLTVALTPIAVADECQIRACVDVYTQDGKIIIEGRKGGSVAASPTPQPKPKPKPKPKVTKAAPKKVTPPPIPPSIPKKVSPPKPKAAKNPTPKKPTPAPAAPQTESLNDRLIKALPTAGIAYQPEYEPLVDVPVFLWTDLPTSFMTQVKIVGEVVDVALRPSFTWSFGDGTFLSTTDVGSPYPDGKIQHTYSKAGTYLITLISTWNGTYTHNAQTRAITGSVKTTSIATITIVTSLTRFKN